MGGNSAYKKELYFLYELAMGLHDAKDIQGYIVQCGAFCGGSMCTLATAVKSDKKYSVVAIDPYVENLVSPYAYQECHRNISALELSKYTTLVIQKSVPFLAYFWNLPIRLAFVDGNHSYINVKAEIEALVPHIVNAGWILFHDYFRKDEVAFAVNESLLSSEENKDCKLYRVDEILAIRYNNRAI